MWLKSVRAITFVMLVGTLCFTVVHSVLMGNFAIDAKDFVLIVMVGMTFFFTKKRKEDNNGQT